MQRDTYIIRYIEHLRRFRIRRDSCSIHPTHPECEPHQIGILAPWGELKRDSTSSYFFTAKGGLFERPTAAFLNREDCCRHALHDIGDEVMTRRKTCFLTGVTISPNKAKPTTATTAFCLNLHPLIVKANRGKNMETLPQAPPFTALSPERSSITPPQPTFSPITMRNSPGWHSRPLGELERSFHKQLFFHRQRRTF